MKVLAGILLVVMSVLCATAQQHEIVKLYDNGTDPGTGPAWSVSYGWSVSDSFTCSEDAVITDAVVSLWSSTDPYNPPERASWMISKLDGQYDEYIDGGESLLNNINSWEAAENTIYTSMIQNMNIPCTAGQTYFLTVNFVTSKLPFWIKWGQNNGQSTAFIGATELITNQPAIPSEAFYIEGYQSMKSESALNKSEGRNVKILAEIDTEQKIMRVPLQDAHAEALRNALPDGWQVFDSVMDNILPFYGLKPGAPYPGLSNNDLIVVLR